MGYIINPRAIEELTAGRVSLRYKDFADAESRFMTAMQLWDPADGIGQRTVWFHLGEVYSRSDRFVESQHAFEMALPLPAAFRSLLSLCRRAARGAEREGNLDVAVKWCDCMLSVAFIESNLSARTFTELVQRFDEWACRIRAECGTLYAWKYRRDGALVDRGLLSDRDYILIHRLNFGGG